MSQEFYITYLPNLRSHPFVQVLVSWFSIRGNRVKGKSGLISEEGQGWNLNPGLSDLLRLKACVLHFLSKMHVLCLTPRLSLNTHYLSRGFFLFPLLDQKLTNYAPWTTSSLLPVFVGP